MYITYRSNIEKMIEIFTILLNPLIYSDLINFDNSSNFKKLHCI